MTQSSWPFEDPPNLGVFTTQQILEGAVIRSVFHDYDGDWTFLHHTTDSPDESEAKLVSLALILQLDPSIGELANLPREWSAFRQDRGKAWSVDDNRSLYTLDSATEANEEFPGTFPIPSQSERSSLRPGDLVKLMFRIRNLDSTLVERLWVQVEQVVNDQDYVGFLANDAFSNVEMRSGLRVEFEADDVIDINRRPAD